MNLIEKIAESNRIEGIERAPTAAEVREHERFITLPHVSVSEMIAFVKVYQPNARIRDRSGLNVRVGNHIPPRGGPRITEQLDTLLIDVNADRIDPWNAHLQYETLHPFTDGNGRSGRMLWYWQMEAHPQASLGFLHAFYYQTLSAPRAAPIECTLPFERVPRHAWDPGFGPVPPIPKECSHGVSTKFSCPDCSVPAFPTDAK